MDKEKMKCTWHDKEWILMIVGWILIFASAPLYMLYAHTVGSFEFRWGAVYSQWIYITAYMAAFFVHHYLIIPHSVPSKRYGLYSIGVALCLIAFVVFLVYVRPFGEGHHHPGAGVRPVGHPMFVLPPPDLGRIVGVMLMFGADLGIVAWISGNNLRQRLLLLEQQSLKHDLMQLRNQINPHFFMNTLNNIHALVDIDQERAKRAIVELSGMMRYSLYEGNNSLTPLQHEVEFLQLYISLMKLRFSNKVELICKMPESIPAEVMTPPLLLTTFVENAFKHGISYQNASFVYITLQLEDENSQIHFRCVNSRHLSSSTNDGHHGIGLTNVRKRLELQYADTYKLNIDDGNESQYAVDLYLPTSQVITT